MDENDHEHPDDEASNGQERSASTGRAPTVLIVVATVLLVVSGLSTWVRTQALDTDEWVAASSGVLQDEDVQEALASYLVDELYANVDVAGELESLLPDDLGGLAGPLAGALRGPAGDAVERVLASAPLQRTWEGANRRAHETLVAIIRDDTPDNISTADGTVTLDLGGAVRDIGEQLGVPEAALDAIPDGVGVITVFESDELANIQDLVRVLDFLSWFLLVLVVGLYVLAVYLARDRRRETIRNVGIGIITGAVALWVLQEIGVRLTVDTLVQNPSNGPAVRAVAEVATQLVEQMAWTGFLLGVAITLYAALIGPHPWSRAIRRRIGETSNPGAVIAVGAGALLALLVLWSPGRLFDRWVTALIVVVLLVAAAAAIAGVVERDVAGPADADADADAESTDEVHA